jgi:hypothetical protein
MTGDWGDAFGEDEAAEERERRRAEREARRRERQAHRRESRGELGDRVKDLLGGEQEPAPGGAEPPLEPPTPPVRPPGGPGGSHRRRRVLAVLGLLAAVAAIVGIGLAVGRSSGGDATSQMTTEPPPSRMITIPEGYDRRQIGALAKQEGIRDDYMKASESFKGFQSGQVRGREPFESRGLPVSGHL